MSNLRPFTPQPSTLSTELQLTSTQEYFIKFSHKLRTSIGRLACFYLIHFERNCDLFLFLLGLRCAFNGVAVGVDISADIIFFFFIIVVVVFVDFLTNDEKIDLNKSLIFNFHLSNSRLISLLISVSQWTDRHNL